MRTKTGRATPEEWAALTESLTPLEIAQALRVSARTLATWRKHGAPWWAARLVAVDILGRLPLRTESGLAACHIDGNGDLYVPQLGRSVHAGDLMAVQLLPAALSALNRETQERQRQAKRLALMEEQVRIVRQLGLPLTSSAS